MVFSQRGKQFKLSRKSRVLEGMEYGGAEEMKKALVIQVAETIFRKEKGTHSSDEVHEVRFPRLLICVIGGKFFKSFRLF